MSGIPEHRLRVRQSCASATLRHINIAAEHIAVRRQSADFAMDLRPTAAVMGGNFRCRCLCYLQNGRYTQDHGQTDQQRQKPSYGWLDFYIGSSRSLSYYLTPPVLGLQNKRWELNAIANTTGITENITLVNHALLKRSVSLFLKRQRFVTVTDLDYGIAHIRR